jgi:multiple sugar transport system permease protein
MSMASKPGLHWPMNPGFWFVAPALSVIVLFFFVPVIAALVLSFSDFDIYALGDLSALRWIGFGNYLHLLHDPLFWVALKNTLYFVMIGGPLSVSASLAAALLVNHRLVRLKGMFRTLFFLPVVTTLVAVAVVWRYLYHPRYGFLNYLLGLLGIQAIDWLGNPDWAMPSIILMAIWNIPVRLYEAATIDGAGAWSQFRHVTLPLLAPTFVFVTVITMIGYLQLFAEPYVMTQGGPANSTLSLSLLMFRDGFRWWNMGYASATAFVLFAIILSGTLFQLKLKKES